MKIIQDAQRQINLHPLVVYFVMSPDKKEELAEALKQLNKYKGYTRGIFQFQTVERVGNFSAEVSSDVTESIKRYNMFVRLANDSTESFLYAVHKVNFNLSDDQVEYSIQKFIVEVCKENVRLLENKITLLSSDENTAPERLFALRQMQQTFREAMAKENFKHGVWARLMGHEVAVVRPVAEHIVRNGNDKRMPRGFAEKFEKAARSNNPEYLWSWIESYTGAPDKETSDEIAKGYFDTEYDHTLRRDKKQRNRPKDTPEISVEIKHNRQKTFKDGREKYNYDLIFMVNGDMFPVHLGSKDQMMLYVCTLLRHIMGEKMYIHEFIHNTKGKSAKTRFQRKNSQRWLKAVYDTLYPYEARDFNQWYRSLETRKGSPLSQAKTQSDKQVEQALEPYPSAVYFCTTNTKEDKLGDSYYDIKIDPKRIIIPEEMQFLIDEFYDLVGLDSK